MDQPPLISANKILVCREQDTSDRNLHVIETHKRKPITFLIRLWYTIKIYRWTVIFITDIQYHLHLTPTQPAETQRPLLADHLCLPELQKLQAQNLLIFITRVTEKRGNVVIAPVMFSTLYFLFAINYLE